MIDFQALKARVSIEDGAKFLNLNLKGENGQFRSVCPACETDDPRSLVITPEKGLFYCFKSSRGGDVIALVAHVHKTTQRAAAEELAKLTPSPPQAAQEESFGPLKNLDHSHEMLKPLNLQTNVAEKLGIGFCNKGLMRGLVAVPIRLPDGKLVGYIGITEAKVPKVWRLS